MIIKIIAYDLSYLLGLMFITMYLSGCTFNKVHKDVYYCAINQEDSLKYFSRDIYPWRLSVPNHLGIVLPRLNSEYDIPMFDLVKFNHCINCKNPSICSPSVFVDIPHESCLVNVNSSQD